MKRNEHKYTLLRIYRLILAPFYSLLSIFLIKKEKRIVITASLNMEYSDNARALFEILINDKKYADKVYFILNDENKRNNLNQEYPDRFIDNLSFKNAIFILKSKYWFCSANELPLGTFFQRHLRQVIHLGHGMPYKKIGLMETGVKWYKKVYYSLINSNYSYTIVTTEFCKKHVAKGFGLPKKRVLMTPQPKTVQIKWPVKIQEPILEDNLVINILYAPTWRPYADVILFPFEDLNLSDLDLFLKKYDIHIWLRVHPRFEQNIDSNLLNIENIHLFSGNKYSEINLYLNYFNGLITDYSSIYYDFLTLERPVLFFDYDFAKYNENVGVIDDFKDVKCIETTVSMFQFMEQLKEIKIDECDLKEIKRINKIINYPINGKDIKHVLLEKLMLNDL